MVVTGITEPPRIIADILPLLARLLPAESGAKLRQTCRTAASMITTTDLIFGEVSAFLHCFGCTAAWMHAVQMHPKGYLALSSISRMSKWSMSTQIEMHCWALTAGITTANLELMQWCIDKERGLPQYCLDKALIQAIHDNCVSAIYVLVNAGANVVGNLYCHPLEAALISCESLELMEYLMNMGADPHEALETRRAPITFPKYLCASLDIYDFMIFHAQ